MITPAIRNGIPKVIASSGPSARQILRKTAYAYLHDGRTSIGAHVSSVNTGTKQALARAKNVGWRLSDKVQYIMRSVPHALAIISSISKEEGSHRKGLLVSSFNSVAISPIPYVSLNIKIPSGTFDAIQSSKRFMVSVIDDSATASAFAKIAKGDDNKQWEEMLEPDGKLKDRHGGMVWMECKWVERKKVEVADHVILVGEVLEAGIYGNRDLEESTMVYWQRGYENISHKKSPTAQEQPSRTPPTLPIRYTKFPEYTKRIIRYTTEDLAQAKSPVQYEPNAVKDVRYRHLDFDR
ncbi:MAG: hypothetical protein Q9164_004200 [Protoblastenia rupestris]